MHQRRRRHRRRGTITGRRHLLAFQTRASSQPRGFILFYFSIHRCGWAGKKKTAYVICEPGDVFDFFFFPLSIRKKTEFSKFTPQTGDKVP